MAPRLKLIDNSVPCELGVIGMICGVEAQGAFASRITRCLAGAANDVEAETSLQRLEALRGSDLYKWAPQASQSSLQHTQKIMAAVCEGSVVPINLAASAETNSGHNWNLRKSLLAPYFADGLSI